jgi:hypothetical protein
MLGNDVSLNRIAADTIKVFITEEGAVRYLSEVKVDKG